MSTHWLFTHSCYFFAVMAASVVVTSPSVLAASIATPTPDPTNKTPRPQAVVTSYLMELQLEQYLVVSWALYS